ncbi:sulfatase-like hydrolase/transferase [Halostella litorea]|uniref:sulfatase-like hydrolase/transferase n=1 Tax=Halostella litorea TaxID=2528831 RepID=UPI001092DDB2|nr:sulfatase-like hydrolase/transferase [Halostella litorea]
MEDIVLVTADSVRSDYEDTFEFLSSWDTQLGVTASHYTRPSLAALHSAQYRAAVEANVASPTLAETLSDSGYTCIGLSPTPNTDASFGFDAGFDEYETFIELGNQGSKLRQYLAGFDPLRWIYYKLYPPQAKSENRPRDREMIESAIERFNAASSPRFLWVHLMETHRPYGPDGVGISQELDQKAFFSPDKLSSDEKGRIESAYRDAIRRADENVRYLLERLDSDPVTVFTSDHGEGFGDAGFYYHQAHKRRVDDFLIQVPVKFDGIQMEDGPLSLIDLPPTILGAVGLDAPREWQGNDRTETTTDQVLTVAPWNDKATVAWQDFDTKIVARDADVSYESGQQGGEAASAEVPAELEDQLRDLGYVDSG